MSEYKPKPLMAVREALDFMLAAARPVAGTEVISTLLANGRVLAKAQASGMNVPAMDNTQMDGYAVRAADCVGGAATLTVSQRIPAGHVGQPLLPGTAARIFTGALIPEGADAVVMQEQCELAGNLVTVRHAPKSGEWIRRAGEDITHGSVILPAGTRLRSQELGLAASVGLAELPVRRKLRVAVFFTGDELAMPGEPLAPGAIYNANRYTLRACAQDHDLIITSGGVSVGEEDHIKPAVEAEGRLNMWQIAVKPGKPLAFGEVGQAFFVGLPGNPVSSFVTFLLFVRPFILRLQGVDDAKALAPKAYAMRADFNWPKADRRNEFLRAQINGDGGLDLFHNQSSGVLTSTVWGDGLIDNPPGLAIAAGDTVRFIPFSELLY